jgi:hypothetical protein
VNLTRILNLFKRDRTPTALRLSHELVGGLKIDYKVIEKLKSDLRDRGYTLTSFTIEKPPARKDSNCYGSTTTKYRLHKFTREDCWPCGIKKDAVKHCWHWKVCCNGSVDRGARRCGLAEVQERKEFNSRSQFVMTKQRRIYV